MDSTGDASVALNFYEAALMAVPFLPDSPVQTPAPTPTPTLEGLECTAGMAWMLGPTPTPPQTLAPTSAPTPAPTQEEIDLVTRMGWMVGSDSEQGDNSDDESYGKVSEHGEPAP